MPSSICQSIDSTIWPPDSVLRTSNGFRLDRRSFGDRSHRSAFSGLPNTLSAIAIRCCTRTVWDEFCIRSPALPQRLKPNLIQHSMYELKLVPFKRSGTTSRPNLPASSSSPTVRTGTCGQRPRWRSARRRPSARRLRPDRTARPAAAATSRRPAPARR